MHTSRFRSLLAFIVTASLLGLSPLLASPAAEAAKPKRDISATFKDGPGRTIVFKGKLKPGKKTRYIVERRYNGKGKWRKYKRLRSKPNARYRFDAPGPRKIGDTWCYRIVVPANKRFRRTVQKKLTYPRSVKGAEMCVITRRV